ncbi:MAG: porin [Leptospira sp.]|nr:porin [Leptospira sp.]
MYKEKSLLVFLLFCYLSLGAEEIRKDTNADTIENAKKIPSPQEPILPKSLKFGAFIDSYYLYNNNLPKATERQYTTQAIRNNEFNINLAHIDATIKEDKYRGRLAFQWGTSVNANYAGEITSEKSSNQNTVKHIQEAFVGVKIAKNTWIDAGIFFGNIGHESWISQNNVNYTRAFALDYVPYYSSGVRLTHEFSNRLSVQFQVLNGWQNITENNKDKAIGSQIKFEIVPKLVLTLNQFVGNEAPNNERKQLRLYNNTILEWTALGWLSLAGQFDVGAQKAKQSFIYEPWLKSYDSNLSEYRETRSEVFRQWYHGTIWVSFKLSPDYRLSFRVERFYDPLQVMAVTGTKNGFMSNGYTTTFDILRFDPAMLRLEYVYRRSADSIFEYRNSHTSKKEDFIVAAFTMKF